ncbi:MAG: alpha/beta fold hydrolase [Candidatus Heimdallarchaeota archaeon]|nr:alpha/beta fold hydrolase [Candidatus Heimdallarchaeota archaeon]
MENIFNKKKAYWFLLLLIIPVLISVFLIQKPISNINKSDIVLFDYDINFKPEIPQIDLNTYWASDLARVRDSPLNWYIHERDNDIILDDDIIYSYDLNFTSPNWLGQSEALIEIESDLYIPKSKMNSFGETQAMLLLHGLYSNKNTMKKIALNLAANGFIVLAPDLPGHQYSGGAKPTIENLFPCCNYSSLSHPFLSIMAAIQSIRVLQEIRQVNNSQIGIYGESYGGLIAMYLCGLYPEKLSLAIISLALGNFESFNSKSYFYSLLGTPKAELGENFWNSETAQIIDPIYYLRNPQCPPIAWMVSTNDEIFDINGLNNTYYSAIGPKWLQIHPNGHHTISQHESTISYLANHIFNAEPAPPNFELITKTIKTNDLGDKAFIKAQISSERSLSSVELCYKYRNILGQPWKKIPMEQLENGTWISSINHAIFESHLDIFIISNIVDGDNKTVWFTSNILDLGILRSKLNVPFWILVPSILITFLIIIVQNNYLKLISKANNNYLFVKREQIDESTFTDTSNKYDLKNFTRTKLFTYYKIRIVILLSILLVICVSIFIPWTTFYNASYNPIFLFNNFFTYTDFVPFGYHFTYVLLVITVLVGLLSLAKPKISGIINVTWGLSITLALIIYSILVIRSSFVAGISIGPILVTLCGTLQIIANKWFKKKEKLLLPNHIMNL